jgi:hypothetical protein
MKTIKDLRPGDLVWGLEKDSGSYKGLYPKVSPFKVTTIKVDSIMVEQANPKSDLYKALSTHYGNTITEGDKTIFGSYHKIYTNKKEALMAVAESIRKILKDSDFAIEMARKESQIHSTNLIKCLDDIANL